MCLLFVAIHTHPRYPLIVAGNRDEFYARPTAGAHFWDDAPQVLGGRDLEGGGTWLGVTRAGRWAAVTNFREMPAGAGERSRGHLVSDFLLGDGSARHHAEGVLDQGHDYAGFNLLIGDAEGVFHCSNRGAGVTELQPGIHGLSNHLLDTPWPKVARGKARLAKLAVSDDALDTDAVFHALGDQQVADDDALPDTGIGLAAERLLSPAFIASDNYGTRSSTVLTLDGNGRLHWIEREFLQPDSGPRRPDHFRTSANVMALSDTD